MPEQTLVFKYDEKAWKALPETVQGAVQDGLEALAIHIEGLARINAQDQLNRHPTGSLVNAITHETDRAALKAFVGVPSSIPYGAIHEFGGVITPRDPNGRLRFVIGGVVHFATHVTIPARPYLGPAVLAGAAAATELVLKPLREATGT